MEENHNNFSGGSHIPYPEYQSYKYVSGSFRPVSEYERRAIKKNYSTAFSEVIIHAVGSIVLANVVFILMMIFGYEFRINDENTQILDVPYMIAGSLPSILFCTGIFLFDKGKCRKKLSEYFRGDDITAGTVFGFFGMVMLFYVLSVIVQQIVLGGCFAAGFSPIKEEYLTEEELSVPFLIWEVLLTGIIGPIAEELMFRGVILRRLSIVSQRFAIFASALIFGMMHGNLVQMILGFFVGLVFGYAAVKTGSLLLPVAGHIFINLFATSNNIVKFLTDDSTVEGYWLAYLGVFLLIGAVTLAVLLSRRRISLPRSTEYHSTRTFPIIVKCVSFWVMTAILIIEIVSKFGPVTEKLLE